MNDTTPSHAHQHASTSHGQPTSEKLHSPHGIPHQSVTSLVRQWADARARTFQARHLPDVSLDRDDLFTELAYGARIAEEVTSGRWCAVAELLHAGAVSSWWRIAIAMGMTDTEAHDGFHAWIAGQVNLRRRTGTIGLTDTEATELSALAEAVPL